MTYGQYITKTRFWGQGLSGPVNLPYGTVCGTAEGTICHGGKPVCNVQSQNAYDYFTQNDDGQGLRRGDLTSAITTMLAKRDNEHQARWDRVWTDSLCQRYRRRDYEDYWLRNHDFYNAPIEDLQYIYTLNTKGARPFV